MTKSIAVFCQAHRKTITTIVLALLIVLAVIIVLRSWSYRRLEKLNNQLQAQVADLNSQLENSERQVAVLTESTNALTQQVSELDSLKEDLQNQLEELLNIQAAVPVVTTAQLEQQLVSIGELATQKYIYRNATRRDGSKEWLWGWTMPFSDVSLLAIYEGTIKAGIDLKNVTFSIDEPTKSIVVVIPKCRILDHNIPQETINVLEVKNNLFNSISFNDYNQFISAEKNVMAQTAIEQGFLTEANENAKRVIEAFLKAIPGIDAYTIVFR